MSKSRKISAGAGLFILAYIFIGGFYRSVFWPVTGANEFSFEGMFFHNPRVTSFPDHTMCRVGSAFPGLGFVLGEIYRQPD